MSEQNRQTGDTVATIAGRYFGLDYSDFVKMSPEGIFKDVKSMAASLVSQADGPEDRVKELLQANNREVDRRREIATAARDLRAAQKAYLADRGNDELGRKVAVAAASLDRVLGDLTCSRCARQSVTNLDGDELCQEHANDWVSGEGQG